MNNCNPADNKLETTFFEIDFTNYTLGPNLLTLSSSHQCSNQSTMRAGGYHYSIMYISPVNV